MLLEMIGGSRLVSSRTNKLMRKMYAHTAFAKRNWVKRQNFLISQVITSNNLGITVRSLSRKYILIGH